MVGGNEVGGLAPRSDCKQLSVPVLDGPQNGFVQIRTTARYHSALVKERSSLGALLLLIKAVQLASGRSSWFFLAEGGLDPYRWPVPPGKGASVGTLFQAAAKDPFPPSYLQIQRWGHVEWAHDYDMYEMRARTAAATLFVHLCTESATVKHKLLQD